MPCNYIHFNQIDVEKKLKNRQISAKQILPQTYNYYMGKDLIGLLETQRLSICVIN